MCVDSHPKNFYDHRSVGLYLYASMPLLLTPQKLGHSDLYFQMGASLVLYIWHSYTCVYTEAAHTDATVANVFKLMNFKKITFLSTERET